MDGGCLEEGGGALRCRRECWIVFLVGHSVERYSHLLG